MLDCDFLLTYFPEITNHYNTHTFKEINLKVITSIDFIKLVQILQYIGITNVFIIDPSCSNNSHTYKATANNNMKYNANKDLHSAKPSGTIHDFRSYQRHGNQRHENQYNRTTNALSVTKKIVLLEDLLAWRVVLVHVH